ncbi:MAG: hypothetical protein WAV90_20370 [Gordonia amarae]
MERDVEGLKTENEQLRRDVSAARVLAAGADQDVSAMHASFRAQTMILNAVRETQIEHGARLDNLEKLFTGLDSKVHTGFATMTVGMQQITTLLTTALDNGSLGPGTDRPNNT